MELFGTFACAAAGLLSEQTLGELGYPEAGPGAAATAATETEASGDSVYDATGVAGAASQGHNVHGARRPRPRARGYRPTQGPNSSGSTSTPTAATKAEVDIVPGITVPQ